MSSKTVKKIGTATFVSFVLILTVGGIAAAPAFASHPGEHVPAGRELPAGPQSGLQTINTIEGITDWFFVFFLILAVIMIIIAAIQFVAQGGDPNGVSQARNKLIWAVVAIIIAVMAKGIPIALRTIITTP